MRRFLFNAQLVAVAFALFGFGIAVHGQGSDWEKIRPEGEEFTVLIPKGYSTETSKEPYHKMELNKRLYLSQTPNGPVFAVVSLSGIKSNPALYSDFQRMNSYVDAFKQLFVPSIRKGAISKLTLAGEANLYGHSGREYRMTVGDLAGTVKAFATRKRFYAVVYLNTRKDEALQEQFLSSFVLPEKFNEPPPAAQAAVVAPTPTKPENPSNETAASNAGEPTVSGTSAAAAAATPDQPETKPEEDPVAIRQSKKQRPISGGVLNGKAITLPNPEYPAEARDAKASGTVVVQVTVDESGIVSEAKPVSGHPLLVQAAVNAAQQARFSPTLLMGQPVKVTGVIVYNFAKPQ